MRRRHRPQKAHPWDVERRRRVRLGRPRRRQHRGLGTNVQLIPWCGEPRARARSHRASRNRLEAAPEEIEAQRRRRSRRVSRTPPWWALPGAARVYVTIVIAAGAGLVAAAFPLDFQRPAMFIALTIGRSRRDEGQPAAGDQQAARRFGVDVANLAALLLLTPHEAMIVAVAGRGRNARSTSDKPIRYTGLGTRRRSQ